METKFLNFVQNTLRCKKTSCPFHVVEPGYYPRFAYGNIESKVMLIFQNPGSPVRTEKTHIHQTIENANYLEMVNEANEGVHKWLFSETKKYKEEDFSLPGKSFKESFYLTQAYRCADPRDQVKAKKWKNAQEECLGYLKEEINLISPKVIIPFGSRALISVLNAIQEIYPNENLRSEITDILKGAKKSFKQNKVVLLSNGIKIIPIVHPDSVWRNPPITKVDYSEIVRNHLKMLDI